MDNILKVAKLLVRKTVKMPVFDAILPLRDGVTVRFSGSDHQNSTQIPTDAFSSETFQKINWTLNRADCPTKELQAEGSESLTTTNPKGARSERYKTELCRQFRENGVCRYGDKCQFAHGIEDLRTVARHPKYKTNLCRTFHSTGFCPYGARCHFVHSESLTTNPKLNLGSKPVPPSSPLGRHWSISNPVNAASELEISRDSAMHNNVEVRQLIRGIRALMNHSTVESVPFNQQHEQWTTFIPQQQQFHHSGHGSISPSSEKWSSVHSADLMGSTSVSPIHSCSDSPTPSPTSVFPDGDIWTSLASIIGIRV